MLCKSVPATGVVTTPQQTLLHWWRLLKQCMHARGSNVFEVRLHIAQGVDMHQHDSCRTKAGGSCHEAGVLLQHAAVHSHYGHDHVSNQKCPNYQHALAANSQRQSESGQFCQLMRCITQ